MLAFGWLRRLPRRSDAEYRTTRPADRHERAAQSERFSVAMRELRALRHALDKHTLFSITDHRGRIIDVNEGFCRISGYDREELIGQDHRMLNSGRHPKAFWVDMWRTIAGGRPWRAEVCNRAKDGSLYWVDSTNIPQFDADGRVERYISLRFDITARKHAETQLAETRRRLAEEQASYRRSIEGTSDGLWDWNLETDEVWYSDQYKRLLGYSPTRFEEVAPTFGAFLSRLHPDDRDATNRAIDAACRRDAPYDIEHRLRTATGEYRWFRARGRITRDAGGRPMIMSGSATDIHDRHTAQSRLDLATRAASIGLWDWDVPTGRTFFSDTFYTMLGYEPGELPMSLETWKSLVHPDDLPSALADIGRHFRGETDAYLNEHRLRCKDGSYLWIRDVGEIVERDDDGSPVRMIGVHLDIQPLKEAIERAETASRAKSEFLANMSHEIRTPLTSIMGFAELLDEEALRDDPRRTAEAVRSIRTNADHLLAIINDILDMSKIEAGRLAIERLRTSPAQIVEEVASLLRPRATGKGVAVRIEYLSPVPATIESDPTRLRQVLMNLVGNAVKFTELGSVTLEVSCDATAEQLRVAVVDTGIGMSPAQRDRVARFDAFMQADSSMTRKFGGTGLGLRVSSALATLLGGGIAVESALGVGSRFTLTVATGPLDGVPLLEPDSFGIAAAPGPRTAAVRRADPGPSLQGVRILLAEDGPDNQRLIRFHLERAGAEVSVCGNGLIAAEHIEACTNADRPDIVLMDMQMPELDGYGATARLRHGGFTAPIIAVTAHAMEGDRKRCLDAGCNDYLTKPIDRARLLAVCARWAERSRAAA
ncbi:MAG: PAS domain-containing protein [Phycisphaerales bacterium]